MKNSIQILILVIVAFIAYRLWQDRKPLTPPLQEITTLTTGRAEQLMRLVSMQVPATAISAVGAELDSPFPGLPSDKKQVLLLVRADMQFGLDFQQGFRLDLDTERKMAVWRIASPKLLQLANEKTEVVFKWGPVDASDMNDARNKAILRIRSEGESGQYVEAARQICESQLRLISQFHGYDARVDWTNPKL